MQSCSENPQAVFAASDHKTLSIHYAKPFQAGPVPITNLEFNVVSATPDRLVLSEPNSATQAGLRPTQVYVNFLDANTYTLSRSDEPMKSSGTIIRCPQPQVVKEDATH